MDSTTRGQRGAKRGFPATFHLRQRPPGDHPLERWFNLASSSCWLILVFLLAGCAAAGAAARFDVFVGYDGIVPQGGWFPVAFEVENDGPSFLATVELTPGQFNSSPPRTLVVELPTGTTKRFIIPTFTAATFNPNPTWNARLLDEKGRVRAETSSQRARRLNLPIVPLAAAMTRALPVLPELKSKQEDLRPVFARLQPSLFPDNPITLEGLEAFYLSSERALDLKVDQVRSLLAWLYGGGRLIVGLEQINHLSGSGAWLKQLLPCEVTEMTSLGSHGELQQWLTSKAGVDGTESRNTGRVGLQRTRGAEPGLDPYANLAPDAKFEQAPLQAVTARLRDGRVLIGPESNPLAILAQRGHGQIIVLTFAPELEPFRTWENSAYFWAKLIDFPAELLTTESVTRFPGRPLDGVFGAMIDSKQIRKLPVGWLLLLLIGYLLVIGPFDQYWLKRLNRQMLTWLTFPAYVAFFSLLIYFIGYKLRAGETEWNELHVVDVIPHGDSADLRGRTYGSIYSPVNARYTFANEQPFATMRGEFAGNYGSGQEAGHPKVEQRQNGFRAVAAVPVWTSQLFVSDWWRQGPLPVNLVVTAQDVTVDNRLDVKLTAASLVLDDQVLQLGEIPARATKTFARSGAPFAVPNNALRSLVQSYSGSFQNAVNSRQHAFGDNQHGQIIDLSNAVLAASFVTQMNQRNDYNNFSPPPGFDLSPLVRRGHAVLLAWVPHYSFTQPLNQFPARRGTRDTVLRVAVPAN